MKTVTALFVRWVFADGEPRRGEQIMHLCRVPFSCDAMCGARTGLAVTDDQRKHTKRCPQCLRIYLRTMTATDELVGMFGSDGRVRK